MLAIPSALFLVAAAATSAATISLVRDRKSRGEGETDSRVNYKPTFAFFVLMVQIYTWVLTIAMHVFGRFFNGVGSFKYYVTLTIAVVSTIYMTVHGRKVIRQHFGAAAGRRLELSGSQALLVTGIVLTLSVYMMWLIN